MKQSKVLVVYFNHTIAEEVAKCLTLAVDIIGIESDPDAIKHFVEGLDEKKYQYILGLGQYSGRNQKMLRLEQKCNTKWRNEELNYSKRLTMKPYLHESKLLAYKVGHGNSYCNLLSLLMINTHSNIYYNFVHVPKSFPVESAEKELEVQLQQHIDTCV